LFISDKGEVFGWGNSEYGQFRSVTEDQQINRPVNLHLKGIGKIIDVASGGTICMVLNGNLISSTYFLLRHNVIAVVSFYMSIKYLQANQTLNLKNNFLVFDCERSFCSIYTQIRIQQLIISD
jgi:hypothetical protein